MAERQRRDSTIQGSLEIPFWSLPETYPDLARRTIARLADPADQPIILRALDLQ